MFVVISVKAFFCVDEIKGEFWEQLTFMAWLGLLSLLI